MKHILLDQNIPKKLVRRLSIHRVETAFERGWSSFGNGDLIAAAESAGFEVMITADRNLAYQQNLANRRLAILILDTNRWPRIEPNIHRILAALEMATAGSFQIVDCF